MKIIKRSWLNLAAIPAIVVCFAGGINLTEWVQTGIFADPKMVSQYYFGTEAMMNHGSWRYSSASIYAWTAFIEGILLIILGVFTIGASL